MTILKRAFTQLKRHPFKTISLFFLSLILGTLMTLTLLMDSTLAILSDTLSLRIAPVVTIDPENPILEDLYTLEQRSQGYARHHFPFITQDIIHEIGALPFVRDFDYTIRGGALSMDLSHYLPDLIRQHLNVSHPVGEPVSFDLIGVSRPEIVYIEYGNFDLLRGRTFTEEEIAGPADNRPFPILISESFALQNGLSLNSVFSLSLSYFDPPEDFPTGLSMGQVGNLIWEVDWHDVFSLWPYEHEVIGIFSFTEDIPLDVDGMHNYVQLMNSFFVPNWLFDYRDEPQALTVANWLRVLHPDFHDQFTQHHGRHLEPYWLLYDIRDMELFAQQANDLLPGLWIVQDLTGSLDNVSTALDNITLASTHYLFFILAVTLVIFSLLTLLSIKNKSHEIGIYLSLGEKKFKIMGQILLELGVVLFLGMISALIPSRMLLTFISRLLLEHELSMIPQQVSQHWVPDNLLEMRGFSPQIENLINHTPVTIHPQSLLIFLGISFAVIMISIIFPLLLNLRKPVSMLLLSDKNQ